MTAAQLALIDAPRDRLRPARRVRLPTLIVPGFPSPPPEEYPDLAALADRIARLVEGAPVTLRMGRVAYPDFEPCASITVKTVAGVACVVAGPWVTEADHARACLDLTRALP